VLLTLPSMDSKAVSVSEIIMYNDSQVHRELCERYSYAPEDVPSVVETCLGLLQDNDSGFSFDRPTQKIKIHWGTTMAIIRLETSFNHVTRSLGPDRAKVLRLLQDKGALEDHQVTDLGVMSPKAARSSLMQLFTGGYIIQEEISKKPDLQAAHTNYIFRFDPRKLEKIVALMAMKTLLNLRTRLRVITSRNQVLLKSGAQHESDDIELKIQGMHRYRKLQDAVLKLNVSIQKVDVTCIVMSDLYIKNASASSDVPLYET